MNKPIITGILIGIFVGNFIGFLLQNHSIPASLVTATLAVILTVIMIATAHWMFPTIFVKKG